MPPSICPYVIFEKLVLSLCLMAARIGPIPVAAERRIPVMDQAQKRAHRPVMPVILQPTTGVTPQPRTLVARRSAVGPMERLGTASAKKQAAAVGPRGSSLGS